MVDPTCGFCEPLEPFTGDENLDDNVVEPEKAMAVAATSEVVRNVVSFEDSVRGSPLQVIPESKDENNSESKGAKSNQVDTEKEAPVEKSEEPAEVQEAPKTKPSPKETEATPSQTKAIRFEDLASPEARDFDKSPSKLYDFLQKKDWSGASELLQNSPEEAKVWVFRQEANGSLRWRLLPIHGAIVFKAPGTVVKSLLDAYPDAARLTDDQGMLPIHLCLKIEGSEEVARHLLSCFPECLNVKDRKGRVPAVLAESATEPKKSGYLRALKETEQGTKKASPTKDVRSMTSTIPSVVTTGYHNPATVAASVLSDDELEQTKHPLVTESRDRAWKGAVDEVGDYVDKADLQDEVKSLKSELVKTKETSTVLSEHVASLESQLNSRSTTERFLATKIATLDTSLKIVTKSKEEVESSLRLENDELNKKIQELESKIAENEAQSIASASPKPEDEQTQKKVEDLTAQLAKAAENTSKTVAAFSSRVRSLESERSELRGTISKLGERVYDVAAFLQKYSEQHKTAEETSTDSENFEFLMTEARNNVIANMPKSDDLTDQELVDQLVQHLLATSTDQCEEKKEEMASALP